MSRLCIKLLRWHNNRAQPCTRLGTQRIVTHHITGTRISDPPDQRRLLTMFLLSFANVSKGQSRQLSVEEQKWVEVKTELNDAQQQKVSQTDRQSFCAGLFLISQQDSVEFSPRFSSLLSPLCLSFSPQKGAKCGNWQARTSLGHSPRLRVLCLNTNIRPPSLPV